MGETLYRVGTSYLPVQDPSAAAEWYIENLGASKGYLDQDKAIINLANQSFFLVKAETGQTANFIDANGNERFTMTFEVNGFTALQRLHSDLSQKGVEIGEIEDRGHPGNNFVFYDLDGNKFDVWSELSPQFKTNYGIN